VAAIAAFKRGDSEYSKGFYVAIFAIATVPLTMMVGLVQGTVSTLLTRFSRRLSPTADPAVHAGAAFVTVSGIPTALVPMLRGHRADGLLMLAFAAVAILWAVVVGVVQYRATPPHSTSGADWVDAPDAPA
jgi:hypothetical protein